MMRSKNSTSMQKTYDECYLICSTACYFESQVCLQRSSGLVTVTLTSQNNEAEALRSWRAALDQIYYQNAYKLPSNWKPRTETERSLHESLRDMEKQCKERVDLLEALRDSRQDSTPTASDKSIASPRPPSSAIGSPEVPQHGWLGGGTIKPAEYSSISRPANNLPSAQPATERPLLPERPSLFSWKSKSSIMSSDPPAPAVDAGPSSATLAAPTLPPYASYPPDADARNRSHSPDKKQGGMLKTLRSGQREKTSTSKMLSALRNKPPAAAKAASQAWIGGANSSQKNSLDASNPSASGSSLNLAKAESRSRYDHEQPEAPQTLSRNASAAAMIADADRASSQDEGHAPHPTRLTSRPSFAAGDDGSHLSISSAAVAAKEHRNAQSQPSSPVVPNGSWQRSPLPSSVSGIPSSKRDMPTYRKEYPSSSSTTQPKSSSGSGHKRAQSGNSLAVPTGSSSAISPNKSPLKQQKSPMNASAKIAPPVPRRKAVNATVAAAHGRRRLDDQRVTSEEESSGLETGAPRRVRRSKASAQSASPSSPDSIDSDSTFGGDQSWKKRCAEILKNLPSGVDENSARQILNEIVIQGDEVHWDDVAGLDIAKSALKETVVYPFLRPDLFMGLREPARGMLLFGPPGTGKTMLARAVATESRSTFFAISASSLTSKFLGESEKLVRALFALAKVLAPSIIFVDEIDSLLSSRGGGSEHEATRRIKTEFLIQWSDLAKAAAGREMSDKDKLQGDATRVLVLAATNLPWAIDEAARRRFVRRQYIPLPEGHVRKKQLGTLLGHQKQAISGQELDKLVALTEGESIYQ